MVREGLIPELDFKSNNCKRYHKTFWQKSTLFYIFFFFPFVFGGFFYIFASQYNFELQITNYLFTFYRLDFSLKANLVIRN